MKDEIKVKEYFSEEEFKVDYPNQYDQFLKKIDSTFDFDIAIVDTSEIGKIIKVSYSRDRIEKVVHHHDCDLIRHHWEAAQGIFLNDELKKFEIIEIGHFDK